MASVLGCPSGIFERRKRGEGKEKKRNFLHPSPGLRTSTTTYNVVCCGAPSSDLKSKVCQKKSELGIQNFELLCTHFEKKNRIIIKQVRTLTSFPLLSSPPLLSKDPTSAEVEVAPPSEKLEIATITFLALPGRKEEEDEEDRVFSCIQGLSLSLSLSPVPSPQWKVVTAKVGIAHPST